MGVNKKKLVVIGAGYAGINLIDKLKNVDELEITLINKCAFHLHQTDIHKYISGQSEFSDVAFDLNEYAKKSDIEFIASEAKDVLLNKSEILLADNKKIAYDYLVIATGANSFFPKQIRNIDEYAQDIKEVDILNENREKFLELIGSKKQNKNIAIVGGGLSGVEIALEFAHVLEQRGIREDECRVSLVEQCDNVLPNMDEFLVDETAKRCDELNVKRYHGSFVNEVSDNTILLSDGNKVSFDMVIFVIGVSSKKLISSDLVDINVKNQFVVDEYLRLENYKDVFAIGDVAQTRDENGNYTLPTAQIAKLQANLTAKNIKNILVGKELIPNNLKTKGVMIDLSKNKTVGLLQGLKVKGMVAHSLKRFVSSRHKKLFV